MRFFGEIMRTFCLACCVLTLLISAACLNLPSETEEGRFACESASDCISGFECFNGRCCRPENMILCVNDNQEADAGDIDMGNPRDSSVDVMDSGVLVPDTGGVEDSGLSLFANGTGCENNEQCESGSCVEDVCCNRLCDGVCESCLTEFSGGTAGQCTPILIGQERNDECAGEQTCNGSSACFFLSCPGETELSFGTPVTGTTLGGGWDFELLSWADNGNVACYAGTQADEYPSPYQVYAIDMPAPSGWDVVLTPESGVDVSLVAWQEGPTGCAPIQESGVRTCEASNRLGSESEERVSFVAINNDYRVVILVATPVGGARGGFTLSVVNSP